MQNPNATPSSRRVNQLTFIICCNEAQDVFVAQHDCLVDLGLSEPRALLSGGEDLHSHVSSSPLPSPHLAETPLSNDLLQHDGPGHSALHKQGQTCRGQQRERFVSVPYVCYGGSVSDGTAARH